MNPFFDRDMEARMEESQEMLARRLIVCIAMYICKLETLVPVCG